MMSQKWSLKITPMRIGLFILVAIGALSGLLRIATGLGATTNLNDQWPWGLWIGLDLTMVALAGAGYSMCLMAHVLHIDKFKIYARRGLLISFLAYILVLVTLFLEIGRWDNALSPIINWGHESPLFEVVIAIMIYMAVQTVEILEIITEKIFKSWNKSLKAIMPIVVIIGSLIPFGHQASLGALYLLMLGKLHGLWWSTMIPWLFLLSSFFAGPAVIALDTIWSSKKYNHSIDLKSLQSLMRVSGYLMGGYLLIKIYDLIRYDGFSLLFAGSFESFMFILEMVIGIIIPIVLCFSTKNMTLSKIKMFSVLTVAGIALNRFNVVITGMYKSLGTGYIPSIIEWTTTIGIFSGVILAYMFIVENFNIYKHSENDIKVNGNYSKGNLKTTEI
ncbi:Ni/Fe-hydrogenase 2 integral membrane subunit HybB [Desulfonispora thiosulfatigenes DSM 11270]|uniref:Ni/Fe-hydrogenase 2 integral membrane subunit HybB n=1 Tax=Desulfonispora thiosulfatigenes DSM 11270 TaxID=656914 RepID=A0A1W1VFX0_DESTI|nr:NrfD/PsrC family molybdoenzyme membrane anchor subunit [Desulfonispora thiosulfatigenes]SMB92103.1 Ni/Fe-hydrogenase 2 integral membrane subunit HybB [Desulfonispora thiosulfatigenes DSM 11270]